MKDHIFIYTETIGNTKTYMVKCKKTGGEFTTKIWLNKLNLKNKCLCCGELLKGGNK